MSTKPTFIARWATSATGIAETIEPSEGQKDDGWAVGDRPPSQFFNWKWNADYLWQKWLDDGDVEFASLVVTGAAQFDDDVSIGATLEADAFVCANIVTTVADIHHGVRTKVFGYAQGVPTLGTWTYPGLYAELALSTLGEMRFSIELEQGQRIIAVRILGQTDWEVASDITAALYRTNAVDGAAFPFTPVTLVGSTGLSGGTDVIRTITLNPTDTALATGNSFEVLIDFDSTAGAKRIIRVEVDYDRP